MGKLFLFLITFTLLLSNASAKTFVAKVIKLRGKVSLLEPGSKVPRVLKVGDKLRADTSVLTGSKSFVRVLFDDNTTMNLGPRSKVAIT